MTKIKVTGFKNTLKNQILYSKQTRDTGIVGKVIEIELQRQGLKVDVETAGPDLPDYNVEIKSHKKGSSSDISIGSMTVNDLKNIDYQNSTIKSKLQSVRWIEYDENSPFYDPSVSVVTEDETYDFSKPYIQNEIEAQYNAYRQDIIQNSDQYKKNTRRGWWEKKSDNSWAFRIPYSYWNKYINYNKTYKSFNNMFSHVEN